jgi:membrane protein DedA with SNARE-associated domain
MRRQRRGRIGRPRAARTVFFVLAALSVVCLAAGAGWAEPGIEAQSARVVHEGSQLLERWGYAALLVAVAADFLGVPMPATTVMVAAAVAAMHGELWLPAVIGLSFLGMVGGSQLGYAAGRFGGAWVLHRLPISEERLATVDRSYARWGAWIVVLAPYIDGLRQLNAFTAGMLELPWWRFALASLAGGALWVGGWVGGTYLVDEHLPGLVPELRAYAPLILALAAATLLAVLVYLLRVPRTPNGRGA